MRNEIEIKADGEIACCHDGNYYRFLPNGGYSRHKDDCTSFSARCDSQAEAIRMGLRNGIRLDDNLRAQLEVAVKMLEVKSKSFERSEYK